MAINKQWYNEALIPFTLEEIQDTIIGTNNNSAPGMVIGNLFPIPKPTDWQKNINKTRPSTLLETSRKKALPGCRTYDPIKILNNIMEEAREFKKKLWLFFQDISKAYDSMSSLALQKAMERIKFPTQIISILNDILENGNNKVTFYGLSDPYKVHDGISQGDAISPLLWRIYYDPLLDAVKRSYLGYNMTANLFGNVVNPSKSQVMHIKLLNPNKNNSDAPIIINEQTVIPVGKSTLIRYLGVPQNRCYCLCLECMAKRDCEIEDFILSRLYHNAIILHLDSLQKSIEDAPYILNIPPQLSCADYKLSIPNGTDFGSLRQELFQLNMNHRTDVTAQPDNSFRRHKRLIIFNMDSTLIQQKIIDEISRSRVSLLLLKIISFIRKSKFQQMANHTGEFLGPINNGECKAELLEVKFKHYAVGDGTN
ncbi:hypothetical protein Glove_40g164 [Diversispora epigaea]|uniref:Reverse transcriptase domain-containing protein n=1 Tax=Diversispora epigaea TaxID=1348612 RepID=A0A397JIV5_9GLOM|nr:hypothetical protein Glove_40g164 [Diversispora epigaea]